jgi:hypothetical protein
MGDRANIYVKNDEDKGVYLYTHWGGYELPLTAQAALAKRMRWSDESYLTRIIFDTMTEGCQGQETGFGIATYEPDNEYPLIEVDCDEKKISFNGNSWTFEEYVALSKEDILSHWR